MKKTLDRMACLMVLAMTAVAPAWAKETKLAHVNLQKALNESTAGAKAKEELKQEFERFEAELNAKQEEIKKLKEEIEKKGSVWTKEAREAKEREALSKGQELQKQYVQYSEELNKKKLQREEKILEELRDVIRRLAKEGGYTFVFESSMGGILYSPDEADLTDEVIKEYNKTR
jgi:outer membrane protein